MSYTLQSATISCAGGLDLRSTTQDLYNKPGYATKLKNMECSHRGGYRRINGFQPFAETATDYTHVPGTGVIKGIYTFNETILVARGNHLYHSFDGIDWMQVNKLGEDQNPTELQDNIDVFEYNSNAKKVNFAVGTNGTVENDYYITIVNGHDHVTYLEIIGSSLMDVRYTFKELLPEVSGAPKACKYAYHFKDQVYIAGVPDNPSLLAVSSLFDATDYTGTSSLAISTAQPITGIYPFRDTMIVFCENSIFTLTDVAAGTPNLQSISRNVGCIEGNTIQEVNGDIIYLARDGLRNLAATERIGDMELSTISGEIKPLLDRMLDRIDEFDIDSTVIRQSNQYRLFYSPKSENINDGKGVIGTILIGPKGEVYWAWSEYEGPKMYHSHEGLFNTTMNSFCAVDNDGVLYLNNKGQTFNGERVVSIYETPKFHLGDPSLRKNLHRVRTHVRAEGDARIHLKINYTGYQDDLPFSPAIYDLGVFVEAALYGQDAYGNAIYGSGTENISRVVNVEGSGFTMWFVYSSNSDEDAPYTLQGFEIDFKLSGKT